MDDLQHLMMVMELNNKRYEERFAAQEKAIQVAEANNEKWRANANEWRAAMDDREVKFVSKLELNPQLISISDRLNKIELYRADQEGSKTGWSSGWTILVTVVGLALTALTIFNLLKGAPS